MVRYAFAALACVLLPLAMGNMMLDQMLQREMQRQMMHKMQMQNMGTYGVQMQGMMQMGGQMPQNYQNNWMMGGESEESKESKEESSEEKENNGDMNWWGIKTQQDQEAYLKWCEERKMQMKEQEEAQKLLRQITHAAEEKKREHSREMMMKEAKMKRDNMMSQWRMWQRQLKQAEEWGEGMNKYAEMKVKYMFTLTMDFLKFCKCSDDTAPLQRYLRNGDQTYEPGMTEAYDLSELEGVDLNDEEAVAQRMATLSEQDQIKLFFTGMVLTTCDAVKAYVTQLKAWEQQYNFMGM